MRGSGVETSLDLLPKCYLFGIQPYNGRRGCWFAHHLWPIAENLLFSGLGPTMAGEDIGLPSISAPLSKTNSQDRMFILCQLWQFFDSRHCTWPSILALLWPINDHLSWLSPYAPPPSGFNFLSTMRKHIHVHDNHEIKV